MTALKRRDTDPARRLEELRKAYEHLRAERIRAESDVKRLSQELEQACEQARAEFGTDDAAQIAQLIDKTDDHNRKLVDEFTTLIRDIEARLQSLGEER